MTKNRVVVTGMGLITSIGANREQTMFAIKNKTQGLKKLTNASELNSISGIQEISTKIFGEVNFDSNVDVFPEAIRDKDKTVKLAYLSASVAILDSKIDFDFESKNNKKCALIFGSCNGKQLSLEKLYQNFDKLGANDSEILTEFFKDYYGCFDFLKSDLNCQKFVFANGCAASNNAIGFAYDLISRGAVDFALVGGSDTLSESTIGGFHSLQALSELGSSPFSERIGLSLGDGAGCIVLESEAHAKERNAKIYAEILGYSFFGDAYHTTSPDETGDGLCRTMNEAIEFAGIEKNEIKVVCAHGTGTASNDVSETLAIKNCFGAHAENIYVTSTKSFYGHTLGASGITQAIVMIESMLADFVPPILNFGDQRDGCDLRYVKNEPLNLTYDKFVSNSLAFGGNNVSIVFAKYDGIKKINKNLSEDIDDKIVITGFSAITPMVKNKDEFFKFLEFLEKIEKVKVEKNLGDSDNRTAKTIEFENFSISSQNPSLRKFKKMPRVSQLSIEATEQLLFDANYKMGDNQRLGIIFGICKGWLSVFEKAYLDMLENGMQFCSAIDFTNFVLSTITGNVSIALGIKGYNSTMFGQFSPFAGINYACQILKSGRQDAIIVGGSDQMTMYDKKMMGEKLHKNSFISEGASTIMLETEKKAKARGAKIYAEILGLNTNSFDSKANLDVLKKAFNGCIDETLQKAKLDKKDIDLHINCNFGFPSGNDYDDIFKNTVSSQKYVGTLESASALLNVGMGLFYLDASENVAAKKNILISACATNGINYSFVMRK